MRLLVSPGCEVVLALVAAVAAGCQPNIAGSSPVAAVMAADSGSATENDLAQPHLEAGPLKITWEELDVGMEPDSVFEPWMMTTGIRSLDRKQVRIAGFMSGAIFQKDNIREFPLMREKECPFGPGGQAHHVIEVELAGKLRTSFTTEPITVEGIFSIQPRTGPNGKTWSLYRLEATKVE